MNEAKCRDTINKCEVDVCAGKGKHDCKVPEWCNECFKLFQKSTTRTGDSYLLIRFYIL